VPRSTTIAEVFGAVAIFREKPKLRIDRRNDGPNSIAKDILFRRATVSQIRRGTARDHSSALIAADETVTTMLRTISLERSYFYKRCWKSTRANNRNERRESAYLFTPTSGKAENGPGSTTGL